ncbi:MAG: GspE/PulE family protein [Candidatus Yanofskybacteria bacterium]|nr:GspE/PulE family protein [Candidatus Yanofskybacteria bacterium]
MRLKSTKQNSIVSTARFKLLQVQTIGDLKNQVTELPATQLLEILTAGALKMEASDIHFEPEAEKVRLRYRLDGLLQDVTNLDPELYQRVLNRIKVLAKLKLNVHHTPQDGRFTIRQKITAIEVRVSVLPSEYGETVVMRLLDPRTIRTKLEELGMRQDIMALVTEQIQKPNGALLTTGPTGSGKTTTLYAFVNFLNKPDTKIITIEDPIEYHIEGISQSQVDTSKDYTFANGLRSIVRQDPDIILVGEIRDSETAEIALNAALTGHLVLSTIHTNDAAGTIPRLIDLGVRPVTIAPAISMAMGQRLVRRLCEHCKKKAPLTSEELIKVKQELEPIRERFKLPELTEGFEIYIPGGCTECNQLGYKGRIGIYEVFAVSKEMEKLIHTSPATSDIRDLAVKEGMVTMLQDAYMKLIEGTTSIEEIRRVVA